MSVAADNSSNLVKRPLYVYDLPRDLIDSLETKIDTLAPPPAVEAPEHANAAVETEPAPPASNASANGQAPNAVSCNICGLSFANVQEQRSHAKSDLHGYNVKQRVRGQKAVTEVEFEQMVADLDESISGSEASDSESDDAEDGDVSNHHKDRSTLLSTLLKKQANITDSENDTFTTRKRKRGAGHAPLLWFTSSLLPSNTSLGVYRALFTPQEQVESADPVQIIRNKQLAPAAPPKRPDDEGGVPLPSTQIGPHVFLCMIGGGHFAGMIVSLAPKTGKKQGAEERQAAVLAHKTFHRYTTRRKQGGSQAANDMAKGAAHSAGSSLRRYNEVALTNEIRELLAEWKAMIDSSDLLFIRATGNTNRRTLFGPYEGQILRHDDPRNRGFPFSTRRATQAELMRCFVELTRVKVSQIDEAALAAARAKEAADAQAQAQKAADAEKAKAAPKAPERNPDEEIALLHTTQIEALIRRSRAPALASYLSANSLTADFRLYPPDSHAHHHAPTALHLAASSNSPALINMLLVKANADPLLHNAEGKTAFELAGDRPTRDAFRLARAELGEDKWAWDAAHVPDALSKTQVEQRAERERQDDAAKEAARRAAEVEKLRDEEARKAAEREQGASERRDKKMGKGRALGERPLTAEERREQDARGMTPEMRMRLERERRARAAEERMRRMQQGGGS